MDVADEAILGQECFVGRRSASGIGPHPARHISQRSRRPLDGQIQQSQPRGDGSMPPVDLSIPLFGYQTHVSIDRISLVEQGFAQTTALVGRRVCGRASTDEAVRSWIADYSL
jgi:hypothetical protein